MLELGKISNFKHTPSVLRCDPPQHPTESYPVPLRGYREEYWIISWPHLPHEALAVTRQAITVTIAMTFIQT